MKLRLIYAICLLLTACRPSQQPSVHDAFMDAFHSCDNPCWLGIEVGVTDKKTAIEILEEHDVEYDTLGVIHLNQIPDGLVPGLDPEGLLGPYGPSLGDINVVGEHNIVPSMGFTLDLCVSTIIDIYGTPRVHFTHNGIPSTITYPQYQTFFSINEETQRIDLIFFHTKDNIPPPKELEDWSNYADLFTDDCVDVFSDG